MVDRDRAADVCLTNKQWPQETLISRRLLIDLLLINSKTVWFMGARTSGDSHLAWSGVLWMWGAHPGGPEAADSEGIKEFAMHQWTDTSHYSKGCFFLMWWIQTTSVSNVRVYAGVCSRRNEREHGRGNACVWGKRRQERRLGGSCVRVCVEREGVRGERQRRGI